METAFMGQSDAELSQAMEDPGIAAVESRVSLYARIQVLGQDLREGSAESETSAAKTHFEPKHPVLLEDLRVSPNVVPQPRIVLGQSQGQVLRDEDGVVVPKHVPPYVGRTPLHRLGDNARQTDSRSVAVRVGVWELGGVAGGAHPWEVGHVIETEIEVTVEEYATSHLRLPPEPDVLLPLWPHSRGGTDSEHDVSQRGRRRRFHAIGRGLSKIGRRRRHLTLLPRFYVRRGLRRTLTKLRSQEIDGGSSECD